MSVSRRTFLRLGATAGTAAAVAATARLVPDGVSAIDRLAEGVDVTSHPEEWVDSVCGACPGACPVLLRRVKGKIVGVRPIEPKPCARAYVIPQELYHPDRLLVSQRRRRESAAASTQPLSREAALDELAGLLRGSRGRSAFILREDAGMSFTLLAGLARALGTVLVAAFEWAPGQVATDALVQATGWSTWRPDLENAEAIVSFGWDWLQAYPDQSRAQRAFAALRERSAPMVHVGPRLNLTAVKSHEWIACRPGFEPLVALAAAHLLLRQGRYARSACEGSEGFEEFAQALSGFDLEACERASGVPARRIQELARRLASKPFLALAPRRRLADQWPVTVLNALSGKIGKAGGWMALPQVMLPGPEPLSGGQAQDLPDLMQRTRGVDTLVIVGANPVFCSPAPFRWRQALARIPHVVCAGSFVDETATVADLVLPLSLPQEREETYVECDPDSSLRVRRVRAAAPPPGSLISPEELVFELARRLGEEVAPHFPWRDWEEACSALTVRAPAISGFAFPKDFTWNPPEFSEGKFHLLLETPSALPQMEGAHLPYLLTAVGPHLRQWWTTWVEINPQTAHALGLRDQDVVHVEGERGTIQASVALFDGVPPDAVCLPLGLGHRIGTFAQERGGNPAELVGFRRDGTTGVALWELEKVRIRKV